MCDPTAILIATVASAAITAGGQIYASNVQATQANYQADVAKENRKHELAARDDARKRGEMEQMRHWRRVSQLQGQQRAEMGAAGLDLGFGSALDIQDETLAMGFEDSTIINENVDKEVKGYEIRAANYGNEARAAKYAGKAAKISGYIGAAGTILGTAAQIGKMTSSPGTGTPSRGSSSSSGGGDWYARYGGLNAGG